MRRSVVAILLLPAMCNAQGREDPKVPAGTFRFRGVIVDANGASINNVRVTVVRQLLTVKGVVSSDIVVSTGAFDLSFDKCTAVALTFARDGFDPERIVRGIVDIKDGSNSLFLDNLRIELSPTGDVAELVEYRGSLMRSIDGSAVVLDFSRPPAEAFVEMKSFAAAAQSAPVIFFNAAIDADGLYAVDTGESKGFKFPVPQPQQLALIAGDATGGFSEAVIENKGVYPWRQVKEAPGGGYNRELSIDTARLRRIQLGDKPYLYVRSGSLYAKGSVDFPEMSKDRKSIRWRVRFRVQRDGSRNVTTLD